MRIVVVGAGGVGGYFGARLAAAGHELTFVARGAHGAAIRARGLRIVSGRGDLVVDGVRVAATVAEVPSADLVLVAVKLWDTDEVAAQLRPLAERGAAVLSLQNGVQKDEVLRRHLPSTAVLGGVCYISAAIAEPGVIAHTGSMQKIVFGEFDGSRSARALAFADACTAAAIDVELSPAIERLIWEKFAFLAAMSGTTSMYRQPIGPIRDDADKRATLRGAMREVVAIAEARGLTLASGFVDERMAFCDTLPATMNSSMLVDLQRGNRLELPWLSGAVVDFGRALGVATPFNTAICERLAPLAQGRG